MTQRAFFLVCAVAAVLLPSMSAQASLGGPEASVLTDATKWQAPAAVVRKAQFAVYTQTTPDGVTVRQYVSPAGTVFAVAWEGPVLPDLEVLLATYFPIYRDALQQRRRSVRIDSPALFLESGGMMRAYVGRAYIPAQIPAGMTAVDIL